VAVERNDARAGLAALFQKYNTGEHDSDDDLLAGVRRELSRLACDSGGRRDRAAAHRPAPSLAAMCVRVATDAGIPAHDHGAFMAVAARAMRRAVVEHMAAEGKRGQIAGAEFILAVDPALNDIERIQSRLVRTVECRYFAGFSEEDTARALDVDLRTVRREWIRARAWTLRELAAAGDPSKPRPVNAAWIDAVLDDALALPMEKVNAILERCSVTPGGLRLQVEELLSFSAATKPRFEPGDLAAEFLLSILTSAHPAAGTDVPATPLADAWRIVREIHRGRLGPLYLAEKTDGFSVRKGALRFLAPSAVKEVDALRLRPDWRAIASLTHRRIARVLETDAAEDGRVFVVSELVEGRPIDRYCDEELLTIDQRLELFMRVCDAVQHAHRKLVVHAGIKPSSVIVTVDGEVKLVDFGMAGFLAGAASEQDGAEADPARTVTRPDYTSPEQVRGEPLAVASDVYQLGLLLYLLLTGEHAQTVCTETLERSVCQTTPALPSARVLAAPERNASLRRVHRETLARKLRGDLDAIVMYALRKEPDRRYPSVGLLRGDIQRFGKCLPVWAQADTRAYRVRKFVTRRRIPVAAAAAVVLVGVVALLS
jgi:serine/threonine protein kinase